MSSRPKEIVHVAIIILLHIYDENSNPRQTLKDQCLLPPLPPPHSAPLGFCVPKLIAPMVSTRHDRDHPQITSSLQGYVGMVNIYHHTDLVYKQHRSLVVLTATLGGRPEMSGWRGIRMQGARLQVSLSSLSRVCLSYISDSCILNNAYCLPTGMAARVFSPALPSPGPF